MKAAAPESVRDLRPGMLFQCNLRDALRQPGCPLCLLLREADRYYLRIFLREGKNDGRMLLRLLTSWGLCARHAAGLVWIDPREFGDGLGTGSLYDWLLDQAERLLGRFREELAVGHRDPERPWTGGRAGRQAARTLRQLSAQGGCPACEAAREHADYLLTEFIRALEPAADLPELIALYQSSEGLCLPHWRAVRERPHSGAVRDLLAEKHTQAVTDLESALTAALEAGTAGPHTTDEEPALPDHVRALRFVAGDPGWRPPWPTP